MNFYKLILSCADGGRFCHQKRIASRGRNGQGEEPCRADPHNASNQASAPVRRTLLNIILGIAAKEDFTYYLKDANNIFIYKLLYDDFFFVTVGYIARVGGGRLF